MLNEIPVGDLHGFVASVPSEPTAEPAAAAVGDYATPEQCPAALNGSSLVLSSAQASRGPAVVMGIGLAGVTLVAGIYLGHRILVFFEACREIHVALGVAYLIGLGMAAACLAYFGLRARRRYGRLRSVERFRVLSRHVRQDAAGEKEERQVRALIDEFVGNAQCNATDDLRDRAGRLQNQLSNHSDAKRAIRELEEYLLIELDGAADRLIERCAAQVAVGTAMASGVLDAIIVAGQSLKLVDNISQLYAGRPGILGTIRLLRRALAITVFAEVAEQATELLTDAVATKAAAKLGGRLGQGLANGLLIARLGHAVKRQCRPVEMPMTKLPVSKLVASVVELTRAGVGSSTS